MPKTSKKRKAQLSSARKTKKQRVFSINELNEWKNILKNDKGRTRTEQENKILIQEICHWLIKGFTITKCADLLVDIHGGNIKYYFDLWDHWIHNQSADISQIKGQRGPQAESVIEVLDEWDIGHEDILAQFIFENTIVNPVGFSIPDLISHYQNICNLKITQDQMRKILQIYQCEFDSDTKIYYGIIGDDRKLEYERFLYQYSHALQLSQQQTHYKIYTDETWINQMTCTKESWIHNCGNDPECLLNGICSKILQLNNNESCKATIAKKDTGKRFVILHAMCETHLMTCTEEDEKMPTKIAINDQLNFEKDIPNAELIFEAKNDHHNDYHLQMNDEIYLQWAEHRLMRAHLSLYPNKIPIIITDQAPYHMSRTSFPHSDATKAVIVEYYDIHNIKSIKIRRCNSNVLTIFQRNQFLERSPKGPHKNELLLYLYEKLRKDNPNALEPEFAKIIRNYGGVVLFTVPNNPNDQPFEYCNAYVKQHCKKTVKRGRTMKDLFVNIQEGFYGGNYSNDNRYHRPVDDIMINGWCKKSHEHMNKEIHEILGLKGKNIFDLWDENCKYRLGKPYLKCPWTQKTLNKWKTLFEVIID